MAEKKYKDNEEKFEEILDKLDTMSELDDDTLKSLQETLFDEDVSERYEPLMRKGLMDYLQIISKRDGTEYKPNPKKMEQMNHVIAWCQNFCAEHKGNSRLMHLQLEPKFSYGFAEIRIDEDIEVLRDEFDDIKALLDNCDGFNITGFGTSFLITFYVNDLWKKIKK